MMGTGKTEMEIIPLVNAGIKSWYFEFDGLIDLMLKNIIRNVENYIKWT